MALLIVGLGNPGPRYALTRHNAGFIFLDYLSQGLGLKFATKGSVEADIAAGELAKNKIHLLKPNTFMNLSGRAVAAYIKNTELKVDDILVVHDEVEIPFGEVRFKKGGGDAGHNGLKSLREHLGSGEFYRLRMGVGKDVKPNADLSSHVLGSFSKNDEEVLVRMLHGCEDVIVAFINEGLQKAQMRASQV